MQRYRNLDEIRSLDPVGDHQRIVYLVAAWEFPSDLTFGFNLSFVKALCVPRMAAVFARTGHLQHRTQKRYDDTMLLAEGLCRWGYASELGRQAIQRMNFIHSGFAIANVDYLFVLSSLVFEPAAWLNRYGWRPLLENEELAFFYFWHEVGTQMGIRDIPPTRDELEAFYEQYQQKYFRYSEEGVSLSRAVLDLFLGWYPRFARPLLRPALMTMLDQRTRASLDLGATIAALERPVELVFRNKTRLLRLLPGASRDRGGSFVDLSIRSYPQGFDVPAVGEPAPPGFTHRDG